MNELLQKALAAVEAASDICNQVQAQLVSSDALTKNDRSPVTVADYASQAVVCRALKDAFPQLAIVGEEDAGELRKPENKPLLSKIKQFIPDWSDNQILDSIDLGNGQPEDEFWTLDPIDGTKGFLRNDQYAVALALIRNGRPVLGVLGCPRLAFDPSTKQGTIMYATSGQGAVSRKMHSATERPAMVSAYQQGDMVRFLESVESGHANHGMQGQVMAHFADQTRSVRYDSQVKYAVLSQGLAEVYLRLPNPSKPDYREKIWDHAAGVAIIEAAGGKVSDMEGKPLDFGLGKKLSSNRGVVATNGTLHELIISLIGEAR